MKSPDLFKEYMWLVNTIRRSNGITLSEINEKWQNTEMSGGLPYSRATFARHRQAVEDIFGIIIECNTSNGYRYYIENNDSLSNNSVQNWMISTLTVGNIVGEALSLHSRILLENIPTNSEQLQTIINAMRSNHRLDIAYRRYTSSFTKHYTLDPYCVKLFHRRWYLLGKQPEGLYVFALDRIEEIKQNDSTFVLDDDFNAADYFDECFGITVGDGTPAERIVLRAYGWERFSMQNLPIHQSQKVLCIDKENESIDFELRVRPTADFKAHLLSRGQYLEVIEPQWLAIEIAKAHIVAASIYDKKGKRKSQRKIDEF